jgi:NADH:ubiquinone oxidoreductase subunit
MDFISKIIIKYTSKKVGEDEFGNQYFQNKNNKRFVVYKGIAEPTKIPAEWHSWIHYNQNEVPNTAKTKKYHWQKIHLPNLTGTKNSYSPQGSLEKNTLRNKVSSDYEPWQPK